MAIPDLKKKLESPGLLSQSLSLQERDIETYQGTPASTVSDSGEGTPYSKKIDKDNFFRILRKESEVILFNIPEYKFKNNDGEKVTGGGDLIAVSNAGDLKSSAKNYALTKFTNMSWGLRCRMMFWFLRRRMKPSDATSTRPSHSVSS